MTATLSWDIAEGPDDLRWRSLNPDLWMASNNGTCAGVVEFVDGYFQVNNAMGKKTGCFHNLLDAKRALECPESLSRPCATVIPSLFERMRSRLVFPAPRRRARR